MPLIMIVEDDRTLREGLCRALCDEYDMASASGVNEARALVGRLTPDLVLLDCELPDGNGIDLCRELTRSLTAPIIFLTVLDSELDEVAALRAGACDFIRKPFSLMVLKERIRTALRRGSSPNEIYEDRLYRFDFTGMRYTVGHSEVQLSAAEQKLLRALTANRRRVVPRARLTELLWGCSAEYVDENALSVTMKRLRAKLGAGCIQTVYGLGYLWEGED